MATKKQQRRRERMRRHDGVWVDPETGEELSPEEVKARRVRPAAERPKAAAQQARGGGGGRRPMREVQPPSWRKVAKRGALFAPLMFLLVFATSRGDNKLGAALLTTAIMMVIFLPFSYVMDGVLYRQYLKRSGQAPPKKPKP
jgi:hypothetical protein